MLKRDDEGDECVCAFEWRSHKNVIYLSPHHTLLKASASERERKALHLSPLLSKT